MLANSVKKVDCKETNRVSNNHRDEKTPRWLYLDLTRILDPQICCRDPRQLSFLALRDGHIWSPLRCCVVVVVLMRGPPPKPWPAPNFCPSIPTSMDPYPEPHTPRLELPPSLGQTQTSLDSRIRMRGRRGLHAESVHTCFTTEDNPGVSFLNVDLRALLQVLATYPSQLLASENLQVVSHQFHKKVVKGLASTCNLTWICECFFSFDIGGLMALNLTIFLISCVALISYDAKKYEISSLEVKKVQKIKQKYQKQLSPTKKSIHSKFKALAKTGSAVRFHSKADKMKKRDCEKILQKSKMADEKHGTAKISVKSKQSQGSVVSSVSSGLTEEKISLAELKSCFSAFKSETHQKKEATGKQTQKKPTSSTISKAPATGLHILSFCHTCNCTSINLPINWVECKCNCRWLIAIAQIDQLID